jgi:DNA polymerase III sliding clamp (beta) subunit (PCNA family)
MNNINITVTADAIRSIATDANILHTIVLESENRLITKSDHLEFMVVNKAIASLLKLPISETEVSITDKNIFYKTEGMTIITTLTEGKYFKWKQVIPTEFQCEITFNKAAFAKGIKIASITSSSSSHQLVFKVKGKELSIVSNDVDYAKKGAFKMPLVESNVTEEFTVALNSKYLTQLLISTPDVENLQFKMNTMKANIMGSIEKQLILIMPMAIL